MLQTLQAVGCERDSTVRQLSGQVGTDSCASSAFGLSCLILTVNVETAHTVQEPKKKFPKILVYDSLRDPGIEPGSVPWQGTILPLNQPRAMHDTSFLASNNARLCFR